MNYKRTGIGMNGRRGDGNEDSPPILNLQSVVKLNEKLKILRRKSLVEGVKIRDLERINGENKLREPSSYWDDSEGDSAPLPPMADIELKAMRENFNRNMNEIVHNTESLYELLTELRRKSLFRQSSVGVSGAERPNTNDRTRKELVYESLLEKLDWRGLYKLHWVLDKIQCYSISSLIKTWLPLKDSIDVRRSLRPLSQFNKNNEYDLRNRPKGKVLIVDNTSKDGGWSMNGHDRDIDNLKKLWRQMGFNIEERVGLQREELMGTVDTFLHSNILSPLVIFLLSSESDEMSKEMGKEVLRRVLISQLENHKGHPRLLILPTPKETSEEFLISVLTSMDSEEDRLQQLSKPRDVIVIFPSFPGRNELRDRVAGSWFIQQMCQTFMHEACEYDLKTMLEHMEEEFSKNSHPALGNHKFTWLCLNFKKMFFYPGIYID